MARIDHDRVLDLWAAGAGDTEIAVQLGLRGPETARTIILRARAKGDERALPRNPNADLPAPVVATLARAASERGLSIPQLSRRLLITVADAGLIGAVLDDAEAA